MTPQRTKFDEPNLKAGVRRAWGGEVAPAELRQHVTRMLAEQVSAETDATTATTTQTSEATPDVIRVAPSYWRRTTFAFGAAAAAVLVIGVGLIAFNLARAGRGSNLASVSLPPPTTPAPVESPASVQPPAVVAAAVLPLEVGQQILAGHDLCVRMHPNQHHFVKDASKDNFPAIARTLGVKLKYRVIATSVGGGWDFRGASLCPVGKMRVAHMMYKQGDAYLSVYSLPASTAPAVGNHQTCEAEVNGRPLAAFVEDGGLYCVVASSTAGKTPVDASLVRAVRDQVRATVVAAHDAQRELLALAAN
jgi:hypothetical protein